MSCIICHSSQIEIFAEINTKTYWKCHTCLGAYLDKAHFLSEADEYTHYCTHENNIDDPLYRAFLSRLIIPLKQRIQKHTNGLDYGCGPGPALAAILQEEGYFMNKYDPYFFPDASLLDKKFDFITCSETAEHFSNPHREFSQFGEMLSPKGILGIMTSFIPSDEAFENWYYLRDPTHVVFYCETTFKTIAKQRRWIAEFPDKNIVLFTNTKI